MQVAEEGQNELHEEISFDFYDQESLTRWKKLDAKLLA